MRPIRPGLYRHVIYVQKMESARNNDGEFIDTWVDYKRKFADKTPLKAEEYFQAKAVNAVRTVSWKTRYDRELDDEGEGMRIVEKYHGDITQVYEIKGVLDKEGLHRELEIITEAVVSDGS